MVDPQVEETSLIEEEHELFELLKRKQKITGDAEKKKSQTRHPHVISGVTLLLLLILPQVLYMLLYLNLP
jgi:hypothetical protein